MKKVLAGIVGLFICGIIALFGAIFVLMSIVPTYQRYQLWQYQRSITKSLPPDITILDIDFEITPPPAGNQCIVDVEITLQSDLDEAALSTYFSTLKLGLGGVLKLPDSDNVYIFNGFTSYGWCP